MIFSVIGNDNSLNIEIFITKVIDMLKERTFNTYGKTVWIILKFRIHL